MDTISVKYRLIEQEYTAACNFHWNKLKLGNKGNAITSVICIILGLSIISFEPIWGTVPCVLAILLLAFIPIRSFLWKKAFNSAKQYKDDIRLDINSEGIKVEHILGKSDLNWDFYNLFLETPNSILLYMSKHSFSVIPKKPFIETNRLDDFLSLIQENLKEI